MNIKRVERLYLNDLSKKLYGSASKWFKMVTKGEVAPMTRTLDDGTEYKYNGISYYTVDEVKALMEENWKEEQELKAKEEAEKKNE